jgi:hypothetical protein
MLLHQRRVRRLRATAWRVASTGAETVRLVIDENAPGSPAVPSTAAKTPANRYDFGSPEDFQLQQAMNHLKGKTVQTAKPKEAVATAPAR